MATLIRRVEVLKRQSTVVNWAKHSVSVFWAVGRQSFPLTNLRRERLTSEQFVLETPFPLGIWISR